MNLPITIKVTKKGELVINGKKYTEWRGAGLLNKPGEVRIYVDGKEVK